MNKKALALALAGALSLSLLTACGPANGDATPTPPPTQENTAAPTDGGATKDVTAEEVMAAVSAVAGGSEMEDFSFAISEFYGDSEDNVEEFAFYMPGESSVSQEIFIARVKSGCMDSVKAACQDRQAALEAQAKDYPSTGTYLKDAKLIVEGDWLLFCVCENADKAVEAFQNSVK